MGCLNVPRRPMRSMFLDTRCFRVVFLLLPILCLPTGEAEALGLGKLTVLSHLGARFEAEVQLLAVTTDRRPVAECFRLGQPGEVDAEIPLLTRARISVEQRVGGLRLRIVSDQPINEPLLQLNLRAGCGAEVVRNYLLLIDPPRTRMPKGRQELPGARGAPVGETTARPATTAGAPLNALSHRPGRSPGGAAVSALAFAHDAAPPRTQPTREPPRKLPIGGGVTDRLLLSSGGESERSQAEGDLPLRLSTRLSTQLLGRTSEERRSILRIEYKLLSALYTQAEQQLAVAERLRRLDATLGELARKNNVQATQSTLAATDTQPTANAAASKPPPQAAATQAAPRGELSDWWLEAALLLGLTAGLTWLLRRRSGKASRLPEMAAPADTAEASGDGGRQLPTIGHANELPIVRQIPTTATASRARADEFPTADPVPPRGEDEVTTVLELAEIMVSFGRVKGAEQALEEFIEHHPKAALTPWLKLLEVYRQDQQRAAFEALAVKLQRHFNVAPADWETMGEAPDPDPDLSATDAASIEQLLTRLPTLGKLPHICSELARTWGSPECLAYLNQLLRDNRGGERRGFSLSSVRELLFLIDIQESHRAGPP
jgi:pilus assembly protein FimV